MVRAVCFVVMVLVVAMVTPSMSVSLAEEKKAPIKTDPQCKVPGKIEGIDVGFIEEVKANAVREPEISREEMEQMSKDPTAKKFSDFQKTNTAFLHKTEDERRVNLASLELCKANWTLKQHTWIISRYYDRNCRCWRYRKAFAPVKIWHRQCAPEGQKCRVVNGCCRQKYTWVGMPVWVRYPCCNKYCYRVQWSYIKVGACCECLANVTDNFNCQCKRRATLDFATARQTPAQ